MIKYIEIFQTACVCKELFDILITCVFFGAVYILAIVHISFDN